MTAQEKRQAIANTISRLGELLQGYMYTSMEQIMPIIDAIYEEVVMNEQETVITRKKLIAMAESIIQNRQPQPTETPGAPAGEPQSAPTQEQQAEQNLTQFL